MKYQKILFNGGMSDAIQQLGDNVALLRAAQTPAAHASGRALLGHFREGKRKALRGRST